MSLEAYLLWGLLFGSVGTGYFMYGKKQGRAMPLICGIALIVYPYFVTSAFPMIALGIVLMAIPYFVKL